MLKNYSHEKRQELLLQYLDQEPLFMHLQTIMEEIDNDMQSSKRTSFIENWQDAKDFVTSIYKSKCPDRLVQINIEELKKKCKRFDTAFRDAHYLMSSTTTILADWQQYSEMTIVLLYAAAIVHLIQLESTNNSNVNTEKKLRAYFADKRLRLYCNRLFTIVDDMVKSDSFTNGYDYTTGMYLGESGTQTDEESEEDTTKQYHLGITFRIMSKLLTAAGASASCNKKLAAQLMHRLTGGSQKTFQNMYSDLSKYPLKDTERVNSEIKEANDLLQTLGINITIEKG